MDEDERTAAERYDRAVTAIEKPVVELIEYSRKTRHLTWMLAGSLVLDIVLSVVLGVVAVEANTTAHNANSAVRSAHIACLARNNFKTLDLRRWNYILALPGPPKTAQEKTNAIQFRQFITDADAPEAC